MVLTLKLSFEFELELSCSLIFMWILFCVTVFSCMWKVIVLVIVLKDWVLALVSLCLPRVWLHLPPLFIQQHLKLWPFFWWLLQSPLYQQENCYSMRVNMSGCWTNTYWLNGTYGHICCIGHCKLGSYLGSLRQGHICQIACHHRVISIHCIQKLCKTCHIFVFGSFVCVLSCWVFM